MEPVSLILAALATGAATGVTDTAKDSVVSAWRSLRDMVTARLAPADGESLVDRYGQEPDTWKARLHAELLAAKVDADQDVVAMARAVLDHAAGRAEPKYRTEFHGQVGTAVVGDRSSVNITVHPGGSG
jgi:MoxR-like ATPase